MAASVVALARTAEFQKVMLTGPLALFKAEMGQVGSLVAAPAAGAESAPAADTAVTVDASMSDPAKDLKSGIDFMAACLPLGPRVRGASQLFHGTGREAADQLLLEDQ